LYIKAAATWAAWALDHPGIRVREKGPRAQLSKRERERSIWGPHAIEPVPFFQFDYGMLGDIGRI